MTNKSWLKLIDWGMNWWLVRGVPSLHPGTAGMDSSTPPFLGLNQKPFTSSTEFIPTTLCFYLINCTIFLGQKKCRKTRVKKYFSLSEISPKWPSDVSLTFFSEPPQKKFLSARNDCHLAWNSKRKEHRKEQHDPTHRRGVKTFAKFQTKTHWKEKRYHTLGSGSKKKKKRSQISPKQVRKIRENL